MSSSASARDPIFSTVQLPVHHQRTTNTRSRGEEEDSINDTGGGGSGFLNSQSAATLAVSNTLVNEVLHSGSVPKSLLRRPIHLSSGPESGHTGVFRLQTADSHPLSSTAQQFGAIPMEVHSNPLYTISDGSATMSSSRAANNNNSNNNNEHNSRHSARSNGNFGQGLGQFPQDDYNLLFLSFLLAGSSYLIPYNAYMATFDYFQGHLSSANILYQMSAVYIFCAIFTALLLSTFLVERISLLTRLHIGQILSVGTMFFVTFIEFFDRNESVSFDLTIVCLAAIGCTLQQTAYYGLTAMLERRYSNALMWGEALAGIFIGVFNILTRLMFPRDLSTSTIVLFFLASCLLAFTCFVHLSWVPRNQLVRFYLQRSTQDSHPDSNLHWGYLNHSFLGLVYEGNAQWSWLRRDNNDASSTGRANEILDNDETRMMNEINENLSRVQMLTRIEQQQQQRHIPDFANDNLDAISNGSIELCPSFSDSNQRVQRLLRTDSNEQVFPFGIDEEEVEREIQREAHLVERARITQIRAQESLEQVPLEPNNVTASTTDVSMTSTAEDFRVQTSYFDRFRDAVDRVLITIRAWLRGFLVRFSGPNFLERWSIFKKALEVRRLIVIRIWQHMLSCFFIYTVTMTLFPAVDSEISSCFFESWVGATMLPVFYTSDLLGRIFNRRFFKIPKNTLLLFSFLRIFILALFSMFMSPNDGSNISAFWYLGLTSVLGWSNGLLGSLAIVLAPIEVTRDLREMVGHLMTLCSLLGLGSGTVCAFFVHNWIQDMISGFGWNMICPFVPKAEVHISHLFENIESNISILSSTTASPINITEAVASTIHP